MKEVRQWVKQTLGLEEQTVQLKVLQQGRAGQALEMAEEVLLWGRLVKGRAVGGRSGRWQEAISHGALLTCLSLWFYSEKNMRVIAVFWAEARYEAHQESQGKIRIRDCKPIEGKCNIPVIMITLWTWIVGPIFISHNEYCEKRFVYILKIEPTGFHTGLDVWLWEKNNILEWPQGF